jgi:phage-related minor tail protein
VAAEHIIGIRLTADNKEAVGAIKEVRAEQDKLGASARTLGSEADKLNAANGRLSESLNTVKRSSAEVSAAVARQNSVSESQQKYFDAQRDKAYALANGYKEVEGQLIKISAASSADVAANDAHTGSVKTNSAAIRESLVLMREASRGDSTKMAGSASILANAFGILPAMLSPVGIGIGAVVAAAAGMAYAFEKARVETDAMNNALAVTNNYAGMTRSGMDSLARSMADSGQITVGASKDIVTALVASGQIGAQAMGEVAQLSANYARATGTDIEKVAPELVKLFSDPLKGAEELNKSMHFLTAADLDYIESLQRAGEEQKAQLVLAEKANAHLDKETQSVGLLTSAWNGLKNAYNGIGHVPTTQELIGQKKQEIQTADQRSNAGTGFLGKSHAELAGELAMLQAKDEFEKKDVAAQNEKNELVKNELKLRKELENTDSSKVAALQVTMDWLNKQTQTVKVMEREAQIADQINQIGDKKTKAQREAEALNKSHAKEAADAEARIFILNTETDSTIKLVEAQKKIIEVQAQASHGVITQSDANYKIKQLIPEAVAQIDKSASDKEAADAKKLTELSTHKAESIAREADSISKRSIALDLSTASMGKSKDEIDALKIAEIEKSIAEDKAAMQWLSQNTVIVAGLEKRIAANEKLIKSEQNNAQEVASKKYAPQLENVYSSAFAPGANVIDSTAKSFGKSMGTEFSKGVNDTLVNATGMKEFSANIGASMAAGMDWVKGINWKGTKNADGSMSQSSAPNLTAAQGSTLALAAIPIVLSALSSSNASMSAAQRQSLTGTGSVLGDYGAKSASIANGISIIAQAQLDATPVTVSMAASLKSVDASMQNFLTIALKAVGGSLNSNLGVVSGGMANPLLKIEGAAVGAGIGALVGSIVPVIGTAIGAVVGGIVGAMGSSASQTVTDKGMSINGTLGQFRQGQGSINQYVTADQTQNILGLYSNTTSSTNTAGVSADVNKAFGTIFDGVAATFKTAATAMGQDTSTFDAKMNAMQVGIGSLSLMNMTVAEQQNAVMNAISKAADAMATQLFPTMVKFQVAGEGMAQTVIRITAQNQSVVTALNHLGGAQTVASASTFTLTDNLTKAAGGLDRLLASLQQFTKFYTTSSQQISNAYADSKAQFSGTAIDSLVSNKTTATQMAAYVTAAMTSGITDAQKAQILAASNSFSAFLTGLQAGIDRLRQSYDTMISSRDAVVGAITGLKQFNLTLTDFQRSIKVDMAMQTNPLAKYQDAQAFFGQIAAKAATGDTVAQNRLQSAGQDLLNASKTSASYTQYQADMAKVLNATTNTISFNDTVIANGVSMLTALDTLNNISDVIRQNTFATNTATIDLAKKMADYATATNNYSLTASTSSADAITALNSYIGKIDTNMKSLIDAITTVVNALPKPAAVVTSTSTYTTAPYAFVPATGSTTPAAGNYGQSTPVVTSSNAIINTVNNQAAPSLTAISAPSTTQTVIPYGPDNPDPAHTKAKNAALLILNNAIADTAAANASYQTWSNTNYPSQAQNNAALFTIATAQNKAKNAQATAQSAYDLLPSYSIGSNYITQDGPAYIHQGEEITPRPFVDLQRSARDETNALLKRLTESNSALVTEVKQLRTENHDAQIAIAISSGKTANNTDKATKILTRWQALGLGVKVLPA